MSFSDEFQHALKMEQSRLEIAEMWARANPSRTTLNYEAGRRDRLKGKPCASANGAYLDGWYGVKP
jgi:hypothetical protein